MREEPTTGMLVSGVHAYAEKRLSAGDELHLRVSAPAHDAYRVAVHRLSTGGHYGGQDVATGWPVVHVGAVAQPQPIHPGSYVRVPDGITGTLGAFTVECWVRPWSLSRWQGIFAQHDYPSACSFGFFIDPQGSLLFYLGNGGAFVGRQLHASAHRPVARQWMHLVGTWDGTTKTLYVNGSAEAWAHAGPVRGNAVPIRMGAYGDNGKAGNVLDGDIAMPVLYDRALSAAEVGTRFADGGLTLPRGPGVLAAWPLDEEDGTVVADAAPGARHGSIVNHATWSIGGPSFTRPVATFDRYDPHRDPRRGHALRLASDDLLDCDWQTTDRCHVPRSAAPGVYAARLTSPSGAFLGDVSFVVKRHRLAPRRKLAVVCSTSTWLAYSAPPFANSPPAQTGWDTGSRAIAVPGTPASSGYLPHLAGQPAYHFGLQMPWPMAQAHVQYPPSGYAHLMGAELPLHDWLRRRGYDFDVLTDFDLHDDPGALEGRRAVAIVGHSEYWSVDAQASLERFLAAGGNALVASGNTMFWRVDFDARMQVMECRKHAPASSTGAQAIDDMGTGWHTSDRQRGGLLRNAGHPANAVVGLESAGYGGAFAPYTVVDGQHFLFNRPTPVGVATGGPLGVGAGSPPGALPVGHEWDVRVSRLAVPGAVPSGALAPPADPAGLQVLASADSAPGAFWDYFGRDGASQGVVSEMVYWERPQGGRVFHTGSIGYAQALDSSPPLGTLLANVLSHFGV